MQSKKNLGILIKENVKSLGIELVRLGMLSVIGAVGVGAIIGYERYVSPIFDPISSEYVEFQGRPYIKKIFSDGEIVWRRYGYPLLTSEVLIDINRDGKPDYRTIYGFFIRTPIIFREKL